MSDFVIENGVLTKYKGKNEDVVIPDGVTKIGENAFFGCKCSSVTMPNSVTSVGESAFWSCCSLMSVTIPETVTEIADSAFYNCEALTDISLPDTIIKIGREAFMKCKSLVSIKLPDSVKKIGYNAFYGCSSLKSISLPDGLTDLSKDVFQFCENLQYNEFDNALYLGNENNPYLVLMSLKNKKITEIEINKNTRIINSYAFCDCDMLECVTLPDGMIKIGECSFAGCKSLVSVIIPDSMTEIGEAAFSNCNNLKDYKIAEGKRLITNKTFGFSLSTGLIPEIKTLFNNMTDAGLKLYVFRNWESLDDDVRSEIFICRQSKILEEFYKTISEEDQKMILKKIKERLDIDPNPEICNAAAAYMILYNASMSDSDINEMYNVICSCKDGKKIAAKINAVTALKKRLGMTINVDKKLSAVGQVVYEQMIKADMSKKDLEANLKKRFKLTFADLPSLICNDSKAAEPLVLAWILISLKFEDDRKAAINSDIQAVIQMLDADSIQSAVMEMADKYLDKGVDFKRMDLAYPICLFANEKNMEMLTKRAPAWRSSASGNYAPMLLAFRNGVLHSDTRAAMMFADRYNDLDEYAKYRNTSADEIRDMYLSDTGLDMQRSKSYDLGNQVVVARMQKDLSFVIESPDGKTSKSIPKKNADPEKYEAATNDFAETKKLVKRILKNRFNSLFDSFLTGQKRSASEWKAAYLNNPVLNDAAERIVWQQNENTFILKGEKAIDCNGDESAISDTDEIFLAHPMELTAEQVKEWQKYILSHGIVQPFEQMWEPVVSPEYIKPDRYDKVVMSIYFFTGKEKHGIRPYGYVSYSDYGFHLDDCELKYTTNGGYLGYNPFDSDYTYTLGEFTFEKYTRKVNHIVAVLDKATITDRIKKDDVSVSAWLDSCTFAQIMEFIKIAEKSHAVNVTALLLDYKNKTYPDFDPMAEFTLEW